MSFIWPSMLLSLLLLPPFVLLYARVQRRRRRLAAADFFAVGARATTVLEPGELVREIEVPRPPRCWSCSGSMRWSTAACAA